MTQRFGNCQAYHVIWMNHEPPNYPLTYRVSHSKEGKVILLWWGDRFWFLLIFWVLLVHEIDSFMPHSSFFIEILMLAFYGPKCKKAKINFGKKSLNVHSVKLFSKLFFQRFWVFFVLFLFQIFNLPINCENDNNNWWCEIR